MISDGSTYGGLVLAACQMYGERAAFHHEDGEVSYLELSQRIARVAAALDRAGLRKGDALAILAPNSPDYFAVMAAAALAGIRYTPLHALASRDDHRLILEDARIDLLICGGEQFAGSAADLARSVRAVMPITSLVAGGSLPGLPSVAATPSDTLAIAYTGGTTGRPKGVVLSHRAIVEAARLSLLHWRWPNEVRILLATPMSHAAGAMILPTLLKGGTVHLLAAFQPAAVLDAIARHRITALFLVPTMIYRLLDAGGSTETSSLELVLYGAAPMSPSRLADAIARFGPVFQQIYGQTETSAVLTTLAPEDHLDPARLASCGRPLLPENLSLFDKRMLEVGNGEVGEICARGPTLMDGYWMRPDETRQTLVDGWVHTGDLARRDADGFIYIVDREKDMIVSGGFNVFPREIEDVLGTHPGVRLAVVIGIPDAKWGEVVHAIVVRAEGATVGAEELIALVREKKGAIHAPKGVEFVDALPLTAIGKVDKKAVRARYWRGQDRAIG